MSDLESWLSSWLIKAGPARPDIIVLIRSFYLVSAASILVVRCVPPLRDRFLEYGARSSSATSDSAEVKHSDASATLIVWLLDYLASWRVSHSHFALFYLASVQLSAYWLYDMYGKDPFLKVRSIGPVCALILVALHSIRRFYESTCVVVPNAKSTMWVGHFVVGLAFYLFLHAAIITEFTDTEEPVATDLTGKVLLSTILFTLASIWQYTYHVYLSSLVKYTLPERYGAHYIVAPHYTAEYLLYFSLAIMTARQGYLFNYTLLCVLCFVVVNLGVTADGTRTWQLHKFPDRRSDIHNRWRMIPLLF